MSERTVAESILNVGIQCVKIRNDHRFDHESILQRLGITYWTMHVVEPFAYYIVEDLSKFQYDRGDKDSMLVVELQMFERKAI